MHNQRALKHRVHMATWILSDMLLREFQKTLCREIIWVVRTMCGFRGEGMYFCVTEQVEHSDSLISGGGMVQAFCVTG